MRPSSRVVLAVFAAGGALPFLFGDPTVALTRTDQATTSHAQPLSSAGVAADLPLLPSARERKRTGDGAELFAQTRLIIEYNATAGDIGVQVFLDGDPWKTLKIFNPTNKKILDIGCLRSLMAQGLTELFFESSEPPLNELPLEEFFGRFPAGEYDFNGVTIEGDAISGTAVFTHVIPNAPVVLMPAENSVQNGNNTVVAWNPVPAPPGSAISAYQVTVTELIDVFPKRVFSVHVPASVTSVMVPATFLHPGGSYEFEVLAIETGGNQTITASFFTTMP